MPKRPGRKINDILNDFYCSLYQSPGQELTKELSQFVENFRQAHLERAQETFQSLPLVLALEFLTERGNHFFDAGSTCWTWPKDPDELVRRIAELMTRQNTYICERSPVRLIRRPKKYRTSTRRSKGIHRETDMILLDHMYTDADH